MKLLTQIVVLVVGLSMMSSLMAGNDDSNESAIKARRALMTLHSWYAGTLFGMAKGDIDYDANVAATAAANLKMVANADGSAMWPPGSDNSAYKGKTRALPEAWEDYDPKYHQALVDATDAMAGAAGNGLDALRSNLKALGNACSGCHDAYRADDF